MLTKVKDAEEKTGKMLWTKVKDVKENKMLLKKKGKC